MEAKELTALTCIKYKEHVAELVHSTYQDDFLSDIILYCENEAIKAHKFVLSAASSYFKTMFATLPSDCKTILMHGIKKETLHTVLKYMYLGEVAIPNEKLSNFCQLADEFALVGISKNIKFTSADEPKPVEPSTSNGIPENPSPVLQGNPYNFLSNFSAFTMPNQLQALHAASIAQSQSLPSIYPVPTIPQFPSSQSMPTPLMTMPSSQRTTNVSFTKRMAEGINPFVVNKRPRECSDSDESIICSVSPQDKRSESKVTANDVQPTDLSMTSPSHRREISPKSQPVNSRSDQLSVHDAVKVEDSENDRPLSSNDVHIDVGQTNSGDPSFSSGSGSEFNYSPSGKSREENDHSDKHNSTNESAEPHSDAPGPSGTVQEDRLHNSPASQWFPLSNVDKPEIPTLGFGNTAGTGFWKNHLKEGLLKPYLNGPLLQENNLPFGFYPPRPNWDKSPSPGLNLAISLRSNECTRCGRLYKTRKGLKHHIKNECGVEPRFQCSQCDWKFKQKAHLLRHMARKHTVS